MLLQVSDAHFGTERPAVVEALVELSRKLAPDLLILSGDLTQRARAAIGARIVKLGMKGGREWSLPKVPVGPEDAEDAEQNHVAPSAPSVDADAYRRVRG